MAETGLSNIQVLENRVEELEKRVFGHHDKEVEYPKESLEVCGALVQMNSQVDSAIAGRPKIQAFMKRLGELERLLDPSYTDQLTLSDASKAEIILAEEELLRQNANNFEKVKDLSSVLSSEHLRVTPAHSEKLQSLSEIHIKQEDATSAMTEDVKNVLAQYNGIIQLLSKQFIQWDEQLTKIEAASAIKVVD